MKSRRISLIMSAFLISSTMVPQEPSKCSPCQAAKSIRDALAQSMKDVAAAVLAAGGSFSREKELDIATNQEKCEKCGCSRTTRDELAANITNELEKCGCSRTTRDELDSSLDADPTLTVAACCEFCAQPGSLGCQGINSARCNTCQQGLIKMAAIAQNKLDVDISRAPREELVDPCDPCGSERDTDSCIRNEQLQSLCCCCASVAQTLVCQGKAAERCCKKLKHKLENVENVLGLPSDWALNIPVCQPNIAAIVNSTEADVIRWLKSIYVLLYILHSELACPA